MNEAVVKDAIMLSTDGTEFRINRTHSALSAYQHYLDDNETTEGSTRTNRAGQ